MKILLFCGLLAIIEGRVIEPCKNDTISIYNVVQNKNILKTNVDSPYQFSIDYETNTLFFSYSSSDTDVFKVYYINLKDKTSGLISGVQGGFATAVDNKQNIVYIGGRDGIYKFDYDTKRAVKTGITDKNIWQLFFKDSLYFTTYPDELVYKYKDGVVSLMPELAGTNAMLVAVDNEDNILYSHGGTLFKLRNGQKESLGDFHLNAFNLDNAGNLYFSTANTIYRIKENTEIVELTSMPSIYGFAVKSDANIIYGDDSNIIELEPTNEKCYYQPSETRNKKNFYGLYAANNGGYCCLTPSVLFLFLAIVPSCVSFS